MNPFPIRPAPRQEQRERAGEGTAAYGAMQRADTAPTEGRSQSAHRAANAVVYAYAARGRRSRLPRIDDAGSAPRARGAG